MWVPGYTLRASDLIQRRGRKPTTVEDVASKSIADAGLALAPIQYRFSGAVHSRILTMM